MWRQNLTFTDSVLLNIEHGHLYRVFLVLITFFCTWVGISSYKTVALSESQQYLQFGQICLRAITAQLFNDFNAFIIIILFIKNAKNWKGRFNFLFLMELKEEEAVTILSGWKLNPEVWILVYFVSYWIHSA